MQKVCKLNSDQMVNLFVIKNGENPENRQPLVNIATSIAAPNNVAISLSSMKENGTKEMSTFVEKRINTDKIDFFQSTEKPKLLTFAVQAVRIV